jgi:hypothetical protein
MEYAHKEVYAQEGKWKSGDWFTQPAGIKRVGKEVYPSWWDKNQAQSGVKLVFDKLSKKKATDCTPEGAKIEINAFKSKDPVTKRDVYTGLPSDYDYKKDDDIHSCSDAQASVSSSVSGSSGNWIVTLSVSSGKFDIENVSASVNGTQLTLTKSGGTYKATYSGEDSPAGKMMFAKLVQAVPGAKAEARKVSKKDQAEASVATKKTAEPEKKVLKGRLPRQQAETAQQKPQASRGQRAASTAANKPKEKVTEKSAVARKAPSRRRRSPEDSLVELANGQ